MKIALQVTDLVLGDLVPEVLTIFFRRIITTNDFA